ncbi:MAG: alpha-ketoacid dehydrogenase subunit beta [Spirochaetia bacterium]|jgi:pyruvate/2-oxoglutarate/acetoin dehydrogenase E1 component|uniref:Acetoin:2,6-dichlorophenolindophenol oxidoreductase subunit beta n=1 Tax=bioreactor metagenome TaxID=1076179 RepID=A0A644TLG9_9ZZZZ|nr:alpha-ketoacid dehydrogenase subunit beta [Spirochaetia bacterium]MCE1208454.1 alpha-ketoacid dehydrogenase subunit beta [Spirochaetia bacterium]
MRTITMRQSINEALHIAFNSDETIFTVGEDIAKYGGQLRCSYDLLDNFGAERVRDTPISEMAIIGVGNGASMIGMRPIVELSYIDFLGTSFDQVLNQAAKMRYMYGGRVDLPFVIRTQCGAGLGNGAQHSQSLEALLCHIPGIRVVMPSDAYDAKGLLLHAIRDNNPVVFIEHKALYKKKCEVPEEPYELEYTASVKRQGKDLTIVTYSAMVHTAMAAAGQLAGEGVDTEVIDLRVLEPLDIETVITSVKKTRHVVIVHEACRKGGFGAELAAQIQAQAFDSLVAPITRLGAPNVPVPYSATLESAYIPSIGNVVLAVKESLEYPARKAS